MVFTYAHIYILSYTYIWLDFYWCNISGFKNHIISVSKGASGHGWSGSSPQSPTRIQSRYKLSSVLFQSSRPSSGHTWLLAQLSSLSFYDKGFSSFRLSEVPASCLQAVHFMTACKCKASEALFLTLREGHVSLLKILPD